ncbi:hypothetical protein SHEWT2_04163 [Shewanella hafniensis]|nr:hypothetical protein SHEWT2_04163 [Shewanella hafniensis]
MSNKNKKLIVHEYPAGAGKTHSICKQIENSNDMFLIAVPTKELQKEYSKKLRDALVINGDKNSVTSGNVGQYIAYNQKTINDTRIVIITHATLLSHGNDFGKRELVIDELPSDLICCKYLKTTASDAIKLKQEIELSTDKELLDIRNRHNENSQEHTRGKVDFISSKLTYGKENFAYITYDKKQVVDIDNDIDNEMECVNVDDSTDKKEDRDKKNEYIYFHYLFLVYKKIFENFEKIHLLGANVFGSVAVHYFTNICDYKLAKVNLLVKGNPMDQNVKIIPLLKFQDGKRDYITRNVLDDNFDAMLEIVRHNSKEGILIATNVRHQETTEKDKHFKTISPKSHGLNSYKDANQAAVIYSANPSTRDIAFMRTSSLALGLPEDTLSEAFVFENVLDVVYQTVTRTAIRDREYHGELTFFVPDSRCANFLASKFKNAVIDWSYAIDVYTKPVGAPVGNTNGAGKKGKGCGIIQFLVSRGVTDPTARRYKKMFESKYGIKPNMNEPSHIVKLMGFRK